MKLTIKDMKIMRDGLINYLFVSYNTEIADTAVALRMAQEYVAEMPESEIIVKFRKIMSENCNIIK